jgi:DNA-binding response OmpR family regulator
VDTSLNQILIIDDDNAITELLKLLLEREKFEVVTINNGKDGIEAAKRNDPTVIILDLMMPDIDGWEVCRAIRSFSQVPIILLSAMNSPGMVTKALEAGADEFLIKPAPMGTLVAHLRRLARRAKAESEAASRLGPRFPNFHPKSN